MIWLAAAMLAAQPAAASAPSARPAPMVQARATVRILTGARLSFDGSGSVGGDGVKVRSAALRGGSATVRLYEFE